MINHRFDRPTPHTIAFLDQFQVYDNPTPQVISCRVTSFLASRLSYDGVQNFQVIIRETPEVITIRFPGPLRDAILRNPNKLQIEVEIKDKILSLGWDMIDFEVSRPSDPISLHKTPTSPIPFGDMHVGIITPTPRVVVTCRSTKWVGTPEGKASVLCSYMGYHLWNTHSCLGVVTLPENRFKLIARFGIDKEMVGGALEDKRNRVLALTENFFLGLGWTEVKCKDGEVILICHNLQL